MKKILFLSFFMVTFCLSAHDFSEISEEMLGKWHGYVLNRGEITFMSQYTYHFLPSGFWSIQMGKADAILQGWYKVDCSTLFLQPLQAARAKQNTAIKAFLKSKTTFEIPNPIDENMGMIFIKCDSIKKMELDDVIGEWAMTQKNLYTNQSKTASFHLFFNKDSTYLIKQDDAVLAEEWATGTFEISDNLLTLKNKYKGMGLWHTPSFFLLNGVLRYNNGQYSLWCERIGDGK